MDETLQHSEDQRTELEELRSQLREARETLDAIRNGEVDALAVSTPEGDKVFTLQGADHPYRAFVEHMGEGAVTLTEEGMILYCNARFARMLGKPLEELTGTSLYDTAVPPWHHAALDNLIARCVVSGRDDAVTCEAQLRAEQGLGLPVLLSLKQIDENGSRTLCLVVTDLTEQKRTHEFKTLLDNSPDAIMRLDRKLRFIYANPSVIRLAEKPPAYYLGKAVREAVSVFDVKMIEEGARKALETGEIITGEVKTALSGTERHFTVSCVPERGTDGTIHSLLVTLHDITPLRQAEQALHESEDRFRVTLGNVPICVATLDRDLRYTWVYNTRHGFRPENVLGKRADELIGPPEAAETIALQRQVLESGLGARREVRGRTAGDEWVYDAIADPIRNERSEVTGITWVVLDITERKKAEKRIEWLSTFPENNPNPVVEIDPAGNVTYANEAAKTVFPGLVETGSTHPAIADALSDIRERINAGDKRFAREIEVEGHWFQQMFHYADAFDRFRIYMMEITERKKAEQKLEQERARLERILAGITDGYFFYDRQWRITVINKRGAEFFGRPADELVGCSLRELTPPLGGAQVETEYQRAMAGNVPVHFEVASVINALYYEIHAYPEPDGLAVFFRDIAERKRAEESLRQSEARFRSVLDNSRDVIYRMNAQTGRYEYISPSCETVVGYSHNELLALDSEALLSMIHPDDLPAMRSVMARMNETGLGHAEYRQRTRAGDYRWISNDMFLIREGAGRPIYRDGTLRDITERKQMELELAESEKQFREIVKFTTAFMFEVDLWNRKFTAVNDAMCQKLGYTEEELLSLDIFSILDDKNQALLQARIDARLSGEKPEEKVEYTCRTKDGREVHALLNVTFAYDEQGRPSGGTVIGQDITERKRMEKQLRRKEEEVRTLIEHSPDIIFRLDREHRYIFVNSAADRQLGIPAASFIGNTFEQMGFDHETVVRWRQQCEDILATGREQTLEFTLAANGETKYFFSRLIPETGGDGKIVSLLGITSDITELKRKEQQLIALNDLYRKAKEEYQRLIDTANCIILRWAPDGTLKFMNDYGLRFFGYTRKELMGRQVQSLVPDTDSSGRDLKELIQNITREPDKYSYQENENVKKSGERVLVMWANKMITDEQGNVKEVLAIGSDITALKRTQEELRHHKEALETLVEKRTQELLKTHAELERTRRMADIGRLASTIAHELRNPLSGIKTAAYNIQRKSDNALLGKHIETINKKVQESDQIINNLLGFTRIKTLLYEPFRLEELVRECVAGIAAKYEKWNVAVTEEFRCSPDDIIEADFTQTRMLLSNLLDNAFQALPEKSGGVTVSVTRGGNDYRIAVTDSGTGIAEEEREKIFEPFYTTKSKGTGLGLTVCREIVELHGGKIHISSAVGRGTTFVVTLPAEKPKHRDGLPAVNQPSVIN